MPRGCRGLIILFFEEKNQKNMPLSGSSGFRILTLDCMKLAPISLDLKQPCNLILIKILQCFRSILKAGESDIIELPTLRTMETINVVQLILLRFCYFTNITFCEL